MANEPTSRLEELIQARNFTELKQTLSQMPPADAAEEFTRVGGPGQAVLIRLQPTRQAAVVFEYLDLETQESLIRAMGNEEVANILNGMSPDDRTALLEELPTPICARLINSLSPQERRVALQLLNYPENSIGRLMTSKYLMVRDDWTAQHVLDHIRQHGSDRETLNVLYVVDADGKLLDDLRIRDVLLSPLERKVSKMRNGVFLTLRATDDQETAVTTFRRYDRTVLPVVDGQGGLVGIVTVDDILDVAEEEATEDIQKIGGMEHLDEPYMQISLIHLIRKRAMWLIVLFLGEMLTASAMGHFKDEIAKAVVLAMFVPLIISSGGNSGSQAATLIIRAMALGEIRLQDWKRVMKREILSGMTLGLILSPLGMLRIAIWSMFTPTYGVHWPLVMLTVGISLIGVTLWGTLSGSMLPFLLKRLGLDPATSSAPFVATLVDVTGLIIYFAVAGVVLHGSLL